MTKCIKIGPLEIVLNVFWRRVAKSQWVADRMNERRRH